MVSSKKEKKINLFKYFLLCIITVMIIGSSGCSFFDDEEVIDVEDVNKLGDDGIVSKAMLNSFAGTDREVIFYNTDNGIRYDWTLSGKQIKNPQVINLSIDFETEGLDDIREKADSPDYVLKLGTHESEMVCSLKLKLTFNEKINVDTAYICKYIDGSLQTMDEAQIEQDDNKTFISFNLVEKGEDYYLIAGRKNKHEYATKEPDTKITATPDTKAPTKEPANDAVKEPSKIPTTQPVKEPTKKPTIEPVKEPTRKTTESSDNDNCQISINCQSILDNIDDLSENKREFVPEDGWILSKCTVELKDGDSVFDVLSRVCKEKGIHMESSFTPGYDSTYIEGINQLYEFDCGELSGWTYKVNGWTPNYGCSSYEVEPGDYIELIYTCEMVVN